MISPGTHVEVCPFNEVELFCGATIVSFDAATQTYRVRYDGLDQEEGNIRPSSVLSPYGRVRRYEGNGILVEDGHVLHEGEVRWARLLSFASAPEHCQSAILLKPDPEGGELVLDFSAPPFLYAQALLLSLALFKVIHKRDAVSMAVLGAGGGAASSCCSQGGLLPDPRARVHSVELSPQVLSVAREWFGLDASSSFEAEALSFFMSRKERYDIVVVDIGTQTDCPPPAFLTSSFLRRALAGSSVLAMTSFYHQAPLVVEALRSQTPFMWSASTVSNRALFASSANIPGLESLDDLLAILGREEHRRLAAAVPGVMQGSLGFSREVRPKRRGRR